MSKPDDIPQDVWDAAILYSGVYAEPAGETLTDLRMDFARAILGEREKCAKVVEEVGIPMVMYQPQLRIEMVPVNIAAAIRAGTK